MNSENAKRYRETAARVNYLAQDRAYVAYSAKVACNRMSSPAESDDKLLKRIARYLRGRPSRSVHRRRLGRMPPQRSFDQRWTYPGRHLLILAGTWQAPAVGLSWLILAGTC